MTYIDLRFLVFSQIGIDIVILLVVVILIRKVRYFYKEKLVDSFTKRIEGALKETDAVAKQFEKQLSEKRLLIEKVSRLLDERTVGLNVLVNRADALLNAEERESGEDSNKGVSAMRKRRIMELAEKGHRVNEIANVLSMCKGEVELILDLSKKGFVAESKKGIA